MKRMHSFDPFDRVIGGGIVPGSTTLLTSSMGTGATTLALQVANAVAKTRANVLYLSSEESVGQLRANAQRVCIPAKNLMLQSSNDVDIDYSEYVLVVVDTLQTMLAPGSLRKPGTPSAIERIVEHIVYEAANKTAMLLLSRKNVPESVEHMVDTVCYLDMGRGGLRWLSVLKNRQGKSLEGVTLNMTSRGLVDASA